MVESPDRFYSAAASRGRTPVSGHYSERPVSCDGPLRLCSYDDRWPEEFEQARSAILSASEGTVSAVEHVGATAVPGMSASPCIDLVAAVDDVADVEPTLVCLRGLDYSSATPAFDDAEAYLLKPRGSLLALSVTLVELGGDAWSRRLLVRDWLRTHADAAGSYLRIRRQRIATAPYDREGYERAKAAFLQHVYDQADAHFRDST